MEDNKINCKDCGKEFVFTVGEQEFYKEKGFENVVTENLGDSYYGYSYNGLQEVRGCFIGDNFYLVGGGQIRIYDMAKDYKEVGRLEL